MYAEHSYTNYGKHVAQISEIMIIFKISDTTETASIKHYGVYNKVHL